MRGRRLVHITVALFCFILLECAVPEHMGAYAQEISSPYAERAELQVSLRAEGFHNSFMSGSSGGRGMFFPDHRITRAEFAEILSQIVEGSAVRSAELFDVADDAWYAASVRKIFELGLMEAGEGYFCPEEYITRWECAHALCHFLPSDVPLMPVYSDVPPESPYFEDVARVTAAGLFRGNEEGRFLPNEPLLRGEVAVILNRLLGRVPDREALETCATLRIYPDVPDTHWAYADIMEAATPHECEMDGGAEHWTNVYSTPAETQDGFYRFNGSLYCSVDGRYLYQTENGVFRYDRSGRYTTGDSSLDHMLNEIVERCVQPDMTRDEQLYALYAYVRDNYSYLKRPLIDAGSTGWEPEYASFFLSKGKGNCYSFAATYTLLCREIGIEAHAVIGLLGSSQSAHGWVEIELDGSTYMFDPQLEWRYLHDYGKKGYNLFKMPVSNPVFHYTKLSVA